MPAQEGDSLDEVAPRSAAIMMRRRSNRSTSTPPTRPKNAIESVLVAMSDDVSAGEPVVWWIRTGSATAVTEVPIS